MYGRGVCVYACRYLSLQYSLGGICVCIGGGDSVRCCVCSYPPPLALPCCSLCASVCACGCRCESVRGVYVRVYVCLFSHTLNRSALPFRSHCACVCEREQVCVCVCVSICASLPSSLILSLRMCSCVCVRERDSVCLCVRKFACLCGWVGVFCV